MPTTHASDSSSQGPATALLLQRLGCIDQRFPALGELFGQTLAGELGGILSCLFDPTRGSFPCLHKVRFGVLPRLAEIRNYAAGELLGFTSQGTHLFQWLISFFVRSHADRRQQDGCQVDTQISKLPNLRGL